MNEHFLMSDVFTKEDRETLAFSRKGIIKGFKIIHNKPLNEEYTEFELILKRLSDNKFFKVNWIIFVSDNILQCRAIECIPKRVIKTVYKTIND